MIDFNFTTQRLDSPFHPYRIVIDIKTEEQHTVLSIILSEARKGVGDADSIQEVVDKMIEVVRVS